MQIIHTAEFYVADAESPSKTFEASMTRKDRKDPAKQALLVILRRLEARGSFKEAGTYRVDFASDFIFHALTKKS